MQTFLPFSDFGASACTIDLKRLGKQIMESGQILRALTVPTYGWKNHPATKMWAGHELQLYTYAWFCAREWEQRRGKVHGAWTRIEKEYGIDGTISDLVIKMPDSDRKPQWLGESKFHRSHQSNLVRKDPEHYRKYFPDVPDNLEYVWPV